MFNLGKLTISEEAIKSVPLKTIYNELEQYKDDGKYFIEQQLEGLEQDAILEPNLLFKKEIHMSAFLILYIETYKKGGTVVLDGHEYLNREINNFAYTFTNKENNFLKSILEKYEIEGSKYEQEIATRVLRKLVDLEWKKKYFDGKEN